MYVYLNSFRFVITFHHKVCDCAKKKKVFAFIKNR